MNHQMYARGLGAGPVDDSPFSSSPSASQLMADFDISNDQLMSVLSARKYPIPVTRNDTSSKSDCNLVQSLPLGFGVEGDNSAGLYGAGAEGLECLINGSEQQSLFILEDQSDMSSIGNTKSRKRPAEASSEGPKERRKKQIREAQRAYRLRKESRISFLTKRVSQLEQVIEDMSTTIATFSDSLLQSGVLAPHATLTQCTRETLEKCLQLAKTTNVDDDGAPIASGSQSEVLPTLSTPKEDSDKASRVIRQPAVEFSHYVQPLLSQPLSPSSTPDSDTTPYLQCSTFMDQLHMAILYRGYLTLSNPSISADGVRQKFRLLYPAMDRGLLASYFAAALHAKISKVDLDKQWRSVPFFQLGGAGTHYAWPPELGPYTRRSRHWHAISVPLSHFSSDIQRDLHGDWFDMQDLECFLMERKVQLVAAPGAVDSAVVNKPHRQTLVNARKLITALLHKALCLGRSAGFRRSDVEAALSRSSLI